MFMHTRQQGGKGVVLRRQVVSVVSVFVTADDPLLLHLERDLE
jgi:hypothetical protein